MKLVFPQLEKVDTFTLWRGRGAGGRATAKPDKRVPSRRFFAISC